MIRIRAIKNFHTVNPLCDKNELSGSRNARCKLHRIDPVQDGRGSGISNVKDPKTELPCSQIKSVSGDSELTSVPESADPPDQFRAFRPADIVYRKQITSRGI